MNNVLFHKYRFTAIGKEHLVCLTNMNDHWLYYYIITKIVRLNNSHLNSLPKQLRKITAFFQYSLQAVPFLLNSLHLLKHKVLLNYFLWRQSWLEQILVITHFRFFFIFFACLWIFDCVFSSHFVSAIELVYLFH